MSLTLVPDQWAVCWMARSPNQTRRKPSDAIDPVSIHPADCPHCERPREELMDEIFDFWSTHPDWWAA
jgi:hypothetical protein